MNNTAQRLNHDRHERLDLQGTLDLLILGTLSLGPEHGEGIARAIQATFGDEVIIKHGTLYPGLQRLQERGLLGAKWGTSSKNRRARFYSLTAAGRKQLATETAKWERLVTAIARVLGPPASRMMGHARSTSRSMS